MTQQEKITLIKNKVMAKYIDKDVVIAEIKRWIELLTNEKSQEGVSQIDKLSLGGRIAELQEVKVFLDTLEVKEEEEEDLELNSFDATVYKIGNTYLKEMNRNAIIKALESYKDGDKVKVIIKSREEE